MSTGKQAEEKRQELIVKGEKEARLVVTSLAEPVQVVPENGQIFVHIPEGNAILKTAKQAFPITIPHAISIPTQIGEIAGAIMSSLMRFAPPGAT